VPEQLLNLLKLFLLVLLYLFFFRVLRAVWTEVNAQPAQATAAATAPTGARGRQQQPRGRRRSTPQLRLLEGAGPKGQAYPLTGELKLGRAAGCEITIDDSFASQVHARVFAREGSWWVEDLGSTNGTYLNRRRVAGPMVMSKKDRLQIGNTVLEMV
jgi:pSer/pThr/pTyr-binding forkhead associated (FHA) protein